MDLKSFITTAKLSSAASLIGALVTLLPSLNAADAAKTGVLAGTQWDVLDIRFSLSEQPSNPHETKFEASFVHETGAKQRVLGFFDGDKDYVLRFCPSLTGVWTFSTESDFRELNTKNGKVQVAKAKNGRKGGIEIHRDSATRFQYSNGEPYYPIAFEADWLFALDAEDARGIPDTRIFVDTLADNGFNQVVMNVFAYDVNWKKDDGLTDEYDYGSPDVFPFAGSNGAPDYTQLNVEYFQRLDRVIEYLDAKGIAAHLMIYVWNKNVNWPAAGSPEDNRYFDYVAKRYQAYPNLVWDISKEALGYGHTDVNYISERIDRLRELDSYNRLITVHDYSYNRRFKEKVDFVSVQLWSSELYSVMRKVRSDFPNQPVLNIEHGGYERSPYVVFNGNYTSPEVCLERAYQCVFAGTYPTHYWQGAAWNVVIPDIMKLRPEERPKLQYYRFMRAFIDEYGVDGLIAGKKNSNAGFSLHDGENTYLYYVPKECDFLGLRLPKELRGGKMELTWFNPFDGSVTEPKVEPIPQWPAVQVPEGDGFRILIVKTL